MRINASDVRVGDYINGLGTVREIRRFQEERSVRGSTSSRADDDYMRTISQELEVCYKQSVGKVQFEATLGSRSCLCNDPVEVVRIGNAKAKSEAA